MQPKDPFRYDGRHVVVVGGATGMGAAAADAVHRLGGTVTLLDYQPVQDSPHSSIQVDLRDLADVDTALKHIDGPVHSVVSAAGVADGTPGLMQVNFIGHRHIITKLVEDGRVGRGGGSRDDLLRRRSRMGEPARHGPGLPRDPRLLLRRCPGSRTTREPTTTSSRSKR